MLGRELPSPSRNLGNFSEMLAPLQSTLRQPQGAASSAHMPEWKPQKRKASPQILPSRLQDRRPAASPSLQQGQPSASCNISQPQPRQRRAAARGSPYSLLAPGLQEDPHKELRFPVGWQQHWIQAEQNPTAVIEVKAQQG